MGLDKSEGLNLGAESLDEETLGILMRVYVLSTFDGVEGASLGPVGQLSDEDLTILEERGFLEPIPDSPGRVRIPDLYSDLITLNILTDPENKHPFAEETLTFGSVVRLKNTDYNEGQIYILIDNSADLENPGSIETSILDLDSKGEFYISYRGGTLEKGKYDVIGRIHPSTVYYLFNKGSLFEQEKEMSEAARGYLEECEAKEPIPIDRE